MTLALRAVQAAALALVRAPEPRPVRELLVLGYAAVGDLVFLLPLLESLKKGLPGARLTFAADPGPTTLELLPATRLADEIVLIDPFKEEVRLDAARFDAVVLSLATPLHLFQQALSRVPLRVGHTHALTPPAGAALGPLWSLKRALVSGEVSRRLLLNRPVRLQGGEHAVRRNLRLLEGLGLPVPEPERPRIPLPDSARGFARVALGDKKRPRVGVHLGVAANQYRKMWPAARFGRLMKRLEEAGLECFLVGGPDEAGAAREAAAALGWQPPSWVGHAKLVETLALIAQADLFLSNDTGLAKAAMAMGVPTATLWGPVDPGEYGIVWEPEKHLDFRRELPCSPCARMGMPFPRTDIDYTHCPRRDCLDGMEEAAVFAALKAKYPKLFPR